MSTKETKKRLALKHRIETDIIDSFDEEMEMEIDDQRMDELVVEVMKRETDIDRQFYFKELPPDTIDKHVCDCL